jgi:DUF1680 family protein
LAVNDQPVEPSWEGPYINIARKWASGDRVQLVKSMPVRVLRPHWRADAVRGCVAIQRGPLVYCLEEADVTDGSTLEDITIDDDQPLEPTYEVPTGLEGYAKVAIVASGRHFAGTADGLYNAQDADGSSSKAKNLTLIPYFARGNRPLAPMRVWVPLARKAT